MPCVSVPFNTRLWLQDRLNLHHGDLHQPCRSYSKSNHCHWHQLLSWQDSDSTSSYSYYTGSGSQTTHPCLSGKTSSDPTLLSLNQASECLPPAGFQTFNDTMSGDPAPILFSKPSESYSSPFWPAESQTTLDLVQSPFQDISPMFHLTLEIVFESPVLGLAKDCNRTGLKPNKTKTEKDHLLVFCSLGLRWSFHFGEIKKTKKNQFKLVFFRTNYVHINYHIGTIFGYFIIFLWNLFM